MHFKLFDQGDSERTKGRDFAKVKDAAEISGGESHTSKRLQLICQEEFQESAKLM